MTKGLRINELAETELADAALWYEGKRPGLGTAFLELIDQAVELIRSGAVSSSPVPGVTKTSKARRILLRRFPYSIVFYESEDQIVIVAFAHSSRRPGYWRSRKSN